MVIQFSHHASEKMPRRGVKLSHIYKTLKGPDEVYWDVEHGRMIAVERANKQSVILAYTEEAERS